MPGSYEEKFANYRMFIAYMIAHPGKKLTFMGTEIAQFIEWDYERALDWFLLDYPLHVGAHEFIKKINHTYLSESALFEKDFDPSSFEWIDHENHEYSVIAFMRKGEKKENYIIVICNFGTHYFDTYDIGVPNSGNYELIIDSSNETFSGEKYNTKIEVTTQLKDKHQYHNTLSITLPPLTTLYYKYCKNRRRYE